MAANTIRKGPTYWLEQIANAISNIGHSSSQVQSDWNEENELSPAFIKNKPGVTPGARIASIVETTPYVIPAVGSAPVAIEFALPEEVNANWRIAGVGTYELKDSFGTRIYAALCQAFTMQQGAKVKVSFAGVTDTAMTTATITMNVICVPRI